MSSTQLTGEDVKRDRERRGLTPAEYGELIDMTGRKVLNIEGGRRIRSSERKLLLPLIAGEDPPATTNGGSTPPADVNSHWSAWVGESVLLSEEDDLDDDEWLLQVNGSDAPTSTAVAGQSASQGVESHPSLDPGGRLLTNSELSTFKRCRRKWWLSWFRRLEPRKPDVLGVRSIGSRIHAALAEWYQPDGQPRTDPRDALERVLVEDWTRLTQSAAEQGLEVDELEAAQFNQEAELARAMVSGYVDWLAETGLDEGLHVTASETPLVADLPGTNYRVGGVLDLRVYRDYDGARLFRDFKTVGDLTRPTRTLHMDEQMAQYMLLERLSVPDGEHCDGGLYTMLRRVKRTAAAKPPFYGQVEVRRNDHELTNFAARVRGTADEIVRAEQRLAEGEDHHVVAYPTPKQDCVWDCDHFYACTMFDDGSRAEDFIAETYVEVNPRNRYDLAAAKEALTDA